MAGWDGNGNVVLTHNWTEDAANSIDIEASRMDTQFEDLRNAIEQCVNLNGENSVPDGTIRTGLVNLGQVQDSVLKWGGTSSGTNAIAFTVSPAITAYRAGQRFMFIAGGTCTGAATVNINGVGATSLKTVAGAATVSNDVKTNVLYEIIYDGTNFRLLQPASNLNFLDLALSRVMLKDYGEKINALGNVTGAVTADIELGNHHSMTLTGNVTLTVSNPSPTVNFCPLVLYVTQDATGGRVVTFPASFKNTSGTTFSIVGTTASKMTEVFAYTLDAGTTWRARQGETWT